MNNEILKYNDLLLIFGELSQQHFDLAPIWCEYYEPSEILDLDVSEDWVEKNIIGVLKEENHRAYYTSLVPINFSKREFLNVSCEFKIEEYQLNGYLYVVNGLVNSVSLFLNNHIIDLFSADVLSDDNIESVSEIKEGLGIDFDMGNSIKYITKSNLLNFPWTEGEFIFPINSD